MHDQLRINDDRDQVRSAKGGDREILGSNPTRRGDSASIHRSPEPGSGRMAPIPVGRTSTKIIWRTVADDLTAGRGALAATEEYGTSVSSKIHPFTRKIEGLDQTGDSHFESAATAMAAGFRTWADNYYNKSQAYLYEAELAAQNTNIESNPNRFAILGVDTDENPDLDVISQFYRNSGNAQFPVWTQDHEEKGAIEVKASTSDQYKTMDALARKGMQQLAKRQNNGGYSNLTLELHNDNEGNHWPLTDATFRNQFGDDFTQVQPADWNTRLATVAAQMKQTYKINLPVTINVAQHGDTYCRVVV